MCETDNTGNAGGWTAYWGYNNTSQYNSTAQTLTMHATSQFYFRVGQRQCVRTVAGIPGFDMAYGDNLWYWKHARVGWELGFDWLPINISEKSSGGASVTQTTYTFNTGWRLATRYPAHLIGPPRWRSERTDHFDQFPIKHHHRPKRLFYRHTFAGRDALHPEIRPNVIGI